MIIGTIATMVPIIFPTLYVLCCFMFYISPDEADLVTVIGISRTLVIGAAPTVVPKNRILFTPWVAVLLTEIVTLIGGLLEPSETAGKAGLADRPETVIPAGTLLTERLTA